MLPALPERIAHAALHLLEGMRITVRTSALVAEVLPNGVRLASGEVIPAELVVWAAGVIAPDFLSDLDGLETNRINQLVVRPTLQTTRDDDVFAIGDCAACPWLGKDGAIVPPRAQAAHQQASHMVKQMRRRLHGKPLLPWRYRDFGSLVSLGEFSTVGNLMGSLTGGNIWLEGWFARMMYLRSTRCTSSRCTASGRRRSTRWRASSRGAPSRTSSCIEVASSARCLAARAPSRASRIEVVAGVCWANRRAARTTDWTAGM